MVDKYFDFLNKLNHMPVKTWLWLLLLVPIALLIYIALRIIDLIEYRRLTRDDVVYLELVPPAFRDKSPVATSELFVALHNFEYGGFIARLLRRKLVISLEIVSSKTKGIRFIARIPAHTEKQFRQNFAAYLTTVEVRKTDDYVLTIDVNKPTKATSYKLANHFAFPLKPYDQLGQHDPVSYITNAMTKLDDGELMAMQLVITSTHSAKARRIYSQLLANKEPKFMRKLSFWRVIFFGLFFVVKFAFAVFGAILEGIGDIIRPSYTTNVSRKQYQASNSPYTPHTPAMQQMYLTMSEKLSLPLFRVSIRGFIVADSKREARDRSVALSSALSNYDSANRQGIRPSSRLVRRITQKLVIKQFSGRLPALLDWNSSILSSDELASLYHFPHSTSAQTENVVKSLSKTLPASVGQKGEHDLDIIIGENHHSGSIIPIGLTAAEREHHMYMIGGTGNGKTTLLLSTIMQDIRSGKGVAVIDPHGDLATTILEHIPESRIKDVIYINPDDITHPVGINLLELPKNASANDILREKDLVTERTISVLRKVFSDDDTGGHRIEYVLRNAIHTAFTVDSATLFTVFRLLTDDRFRRGVVNNLEDGDLKNFWRNELGKAGEFQRVKMSAGVTSKIGRFLFSAPAKRMLEQERSTIDFDQALQDSKILICNFSKGLLGEDTSALFGTTILAKLQLSALRRARMNQGDRQPFYLYVDEFQNFATMPFVQMLSEARKYKLFLTMAEQSTSQQEQQRLVDIILANVGTVVAFRSGSPADERYILPLFQPYLEQGEIASLPAFSFYVRIAAKEVHEPMSGRTMLLDDDGSYTRFSDVVEASRKTYGRKYVRKTEKESSKVAPKTTKKKSHVSSKKTRKEIE